MNKETTVLNKWERCYLISVISSDWTAQKIILETVRKEAESNKESSYNRIKLNNEILKFNLFEGLLAKLTGREAALEELVSIEDEK